MRKGLQLITALFIMFSMIVPIYAENGSTTVQGKIYQFDKKSHYEFSSSKENKKAKSYGTFSISGDVVNISETEGISSYEIGSGDVSFSYIYSDRLLKAAENAWHFVDDSSKTIDDIKLKKKINKGVLILQTSQDGVEWISSIMTPNLFAVKETETGSFYKTKSVQLMNGCYYRLIVAYEVGKKISDSKTPVIGKDKYDYRKYAEVYQFYLHNSTSPAKRSGNGDMKYKTMGTKEKTGSKGYVGHHEIGLKDPHYGWDLGTFYVTDYTSDTIDQTGKTVFLKNVGDQVRLVFNLQQNIDKLNNDDSLAISTDRDGYDQTFEIEKTNLGRGALIIRQTNYQGIKSEPQLYTNYLEANATTNADVDVQLFEEGDYEVSLDYEIRKDARKLMGQSILPEYSHYKISFDFSVRNGNCMAFLFDTKTNSELSNSAVTKNGFRIDLAKSRYLDIVVKREVMAKTADGLVEDTRFNRPAKDGDVYDQEGVYTISTSNRYTNQKTIKKIYVGSNDILKAHAATGLSVKEINAKVKKGATIADDGTIIMPGSKTNTQKTNKKTGFPIIIIIPLVLIIAVAAYFVKKRISENGV